MWYRCANDHSSCMSSSSCLCSFVPPILYASNSLPYLMKHFSSFKAQFKHLLLYEACPYPPSHHLSIPLLLRSHAILLVSLPAGNYRHWSLCLFPTQHYKLHEGRDHFLFISFVPGGYLVLIKLECWTLSLRINTDYLLIVAILLNGKQF